MIQLLQFSNKINLAAMHLSAYYASESIHSLIEYVYSIFSKPIMKPNLW